MIVLQRDPGTENRGPGDSVPRRWKLTAGSRDREQGVRETLSPEDGSLQLFPH